MKKILFGLSFFTMLGVSHGATQIYIPSTSTYHNYIVNIESETVNNTLIASSQMAVGGPLGQEYSPPTTVFSITSNGSPLDLLRMTTYGNGPGGSNNVHFVHSGGTKANPTTVNTGDFFLSEGARGYDGSSWSDSATAFQIIATSTWTSTSHPAKFHFETTANGSTSRLPILDIDNTGIVMNQGNISFVNTGLNGIQGTVTNDSANLGMVGEYQSSSTLNQTVGTSTQYFDIVSVFLTTGDWDLSANFLYLANGATVVSCGAGIGTVAGNDSTGLVTGDSFSALPPPTSTYNTSGSIPALRKSISSSTTFYFKGTTQYSVAVPKIYGRISARRVR